MNSNKMLMIKIAVAFALCISVGFALGVICAGVPRQNPAPMHKFKFTYQYQDNGNGTVHTSTGSRLQQNSLLDYEKLLEWLDANITNKQTIIILSFGEVSP